MSTQLGLCSTCLSTDRNVTPMKNMINKKIFADWINIFMKNPKFQCCWECRAMFVRIHKFTTQICKAHMIGAMDKRKKINTPTLSNLSIQTKNTYDKAYKELDKENIYIYIFPSVASLGININETVSNLNVNIQKDKDIEDNIKTNLNVKSDSLHAIKDNDSNTEVESDENTPKQLLLPCYVPIVRLTEADLERYGAKRSRKRKKCYTYECSQCGEGYCDKEKYEIHMQIKHSKFLNGLPNLLTTNIEILNESPKAQANLMKVDKINSESAANIKSEFTPGNCDELQGITLGQLSTNECTDNVESSMIVMVENPRYDNKQQQGTIILEQLSSDFCCDNVKSQADIKGERPQSSVHPQDLDEQDQGNSLGLLSSGDCNDNEESLVNVKEEFDTEDLDEQNQGTSLGLLSSDDCSDNVESLIDVKEEFDLEDYDEQDQGTSLGQQSKSECPDTYNGFESVFVRNNKDDADDIEKPPLEIASNEPNQEQLVPYVDDKSDLSSDELSNDRNWEPSSCESSSESDQMLMENERLYVIQHKVASSHCEDGQTGDRKSTNTAEKEKVSLREVDLEEVSEEDDETTEENAEAKNKIPDNKTTSGSNLKGKIIREKDFCYYCKNFVLNFARHMTRNHSAEPAVQLALSHPKNSFKRKQCLKALRKKGNYLNKSQTIKPVKKSKFFENTNYLPCSKCLGFYSKKGMKEHVKKCGSTASTSIAQVQAKNLLVCNVKVDNNLVTNVFPCMKPDKISLVAKKDKLICLFGAQYLRTHREEHFATVVSHKMRELAKLLVEVMKLKPDINSLEQVLKPKYYDTLVHATKVVAGYNEVSGQFDAPAYAINIATSIKQCCSIALLQSCKIEDTVQMAAIQADLNILSKLIAENWEFDSQATDDLYENKQNETTIVALAADLKIFKDYICNMSKQSSDNLMQSKETINVEAFNNLVESTYCRVHLLNRLRPGELQQVKLYEYNDNGKYSNKYEEFDKILSMTEKILISHLKRIRIRGKGGRGVPVLFTIDVQEDIKTILSVRHMYVENGNNLLFVKADGSTVCDYKIVEKYAKASGAKNYWAFTSTRLRKHLAMMTQLFTMTELQLEQMAAFIGHTLSAHKNKHMLPSDVYQTAKIFKLLQLMEIEEKGPSQNVTVSVSEQSPSPSQIINHRTSANKKRTLVPWTNEQKNVVNKYFEEHIKYKKAPKCAECEELKNKYPTLLHNKDWHKIKVYVQNTYSKQ